MTDEVAQTSATGTLAECLRRRIDAAGTAFVLERRVARRGRQLQGLAFVSAVVPVIVGGLVLGYGAGFQALDVVIGLAAGVTVVQLVISTWALTAGWVDRQSRELASAVKNREISRTFQKIALRVATNDESCRSELEWLLGRDDGQQDTDYALGFSPAETRAAHRAGLREYGAKCAGCSSIPTDMNSTDCGVCGDFIWTWWQGYGNRKCDN